MARARSQGKQIVRVVAGIVILASSTYCAAPPTTPVADTTTPDQPQVLPTKVRCVVTVRPLAAVCPGGVSHSSGQVTIRDNVIGGPQGQNWTYTISNIAYNAGTQIFSWNATVTNDLPYLPMGASDWVTETGLKTFIDQLYVTAGSGSISVANADGTGTFTAPNQPYFEYPVILWPTQVSGQRSVQLNVPSTVQKFFIDLMLYAGVPHDNELAGMTAQIYTGPIATTPHCAATSGTWTLNSATWTMFSTTKTATGGDNCGNLRVVSGGTGYTVSYPHSVTGGSAPVRFGTPIPSAGFGTGYIYLRFLARLETGFTQNAGAGVTLFYPQTGQQQSGCGGGGSGENDLVGVQSNISQDEGWIQFDQEGWSCVNNPPWTYTAPNDPSQWFADSSADLGHQHIGQWALIEMLITPNNPLTSANSSYTLWVDGRQEWTASNLQIFNTGDVEDWTYIYFNPIYGGKHKSPGGVAWDFDELYVSTK